MNQSPIQNATMDTSLIIGPLGSSTLHKPTTEILSFIPESKLNQTSQQRLYIHIGHIYVYNIYVQYMSMDIIKFQCFAMKKLHCVHYSQLIASKFSVTAYSYSALTA